MMRNSFLPNRVYFNEYDSEGLISKLIKYRNAEIEDILLNEKPDYQCLIEIKDEISKYFCNKTNYIRCREKGTLESKQISGITDTLATKIMMGTLGCVPAYDRYLVIALKKQNINTTFGEKSLCEISAIAKENQAYLIEKCEEMNSKLTVKGVYTPIKILDSILWLYGFCLDNHIFDFE